MSRRQSDNEGAKSSKTYPGRDGPVFEENKPPPIGQVADAANGPPISVDLNLDAAPVRTIDGGDCVPVRPTQGLCIAAIEPEVNSLIVPDERLVVHRDDGAVARFLDVFVTASIDDFAAL